MSTVDLTEAEHAATTALIRRAIEQDTLFIAMMLLYLRIKLCHNSASH
jgi:hypothetical protein